MGVCVSVFVVGACVWVRAWGCVCGGVCMCV